MRRLEFVPQQLQNEEDPNPIKIEITGNQGITILNQEEINKLVANPGQSETDCKLIIEYTVDSTAVLQNQTNKGNNESLVTVENENNAANLFVASISVKIDDKINTPSFLRSVRNSPFTINILLNNQSPQTDYVEKMAASPGYQTNQQIPVDNGFLEVPLQDVQVEEKRDEVVDGTSRIQTNQIPNDPSSLYSYNNYFKDSLDSTAASLNNQESFQRGVSQTVGSTQNFTKESLFSPSSMFNTSPTRQPVTERERSKSPYNQREQFRESLPRQSSFDSKEFDRRLLRLFERHETVLRTVYNHFKGGHYGSETISLSNVIRLGTEYDIIPTFISKKEVKMLFNKLPQVGDGGLQYDWFLVCLAEIAIFSLSKPMFSHLYSSDKSKVNVLLNMWGIADANKISAIRPRAIVA